MKLFKVRNYGQTNRYAHIVGKLWNRQINGQLWNQRGLRGTTAAAAAAKATPAPKVNAALAKVASAAKIIVLAINLEKGAPNANKPLTIFTPIIAAIPPNMNLRVPA